MSTRALFTFKGEWRGEEYNVYKHMDGYPEGAADQLQKATTKAWAHQRFEASDFAAAYIAANKDHGGDVRVGLPVGRYGDLAYHYVIKEGKEPTMTVYSFDGEEGKKRRIWKGTLRQFIVEHCSADTLALL